MHTTRTQPEAMIFDLDGTLFKTETLVISAYDEVFQQLRQEGLYEGETPPEERILHSLGMLLDDLWDVVLPETPHDLRDRASELLLQKEIEGLERGEGELYPGVEATLQQLHEKGIRLFVASNGLEQYVKKTIEHMGLNDLFTAVYSAGEFNTSSKVDLVRLILDRYEISSAWMVGDRSSDVEAGSKNGLIVAGCHYAGFGKLDELKGSDHILTSFSDILSILDAQVERL